MNDYGGDRGDFGRQASDLGRGFLAYLRSRSTDHWLFFAVGLIIGLIVS